MALAELVQGVAGISHLVGDATRAVSTIGQLSDAGSEALAFSEAEPPPSTAAGAVIVRAAPETSSPQGPVWIVAPSPRAAFARLAGRLVRVRPWSTGAEAVAASAVIASDASIGPGAVIGDLARIGEGAVIGPNAVIGAGVCIGRGSIIGPNSVIQCALIGDFVTVLPGALIGQAGFGVAQDTEGLVDMPHFGRVIIQDHATIGAGCTIDRGMLRDTVIAEHAKLDNLCHIAHNVVVGRGVRMAAFAGVSGSTTLGDHVLIGGRVGIVDHIAIGDEAVLAAAAVVMQDVPPKQVWGGYPAKPRMQWLREVAWLAKSSRSGPKATTGKRDGDAS